MSEKIELLVGHSFLEPDVVVVQKAYRIGEYKDDVGNALGPMYNDSTEAWLNRNDMTCTIVTIQKELFPLVAKKYKRLVRAGNDASVSDKEVNQLKDDFLQFVQFV